MRIFIAGASGAIGRRLTPLLRKAGHDVTGMTRSADVARELEAAGIGPAIVDVFDAQALKGAVVAARPDVVMHQLTDLPRVLDDEAQLAAAYPRNARIRTEGTRNLIAAAQAAAARRFIVQSIAFAYASGGEPHPETDPLTLADPARAVTVKGAADMERQVLGASGIEARASKPKGNAPDIAAGVFLFAASALFLDPRALLFEGSPPDGEEQRPHLSWFRALRRNRRSDVDFFRENAREPGLT